MSLIVDDDYFKDTATFISKRLGNLQYCIQQYKYILKQVKKYGIQEGATADALGTFIDQVEGLSTGSFTGMTDLGEKSETFIEAYIDALDDADGELY